MIDELKCPICKNFLDEPILLQCSHAYCKECAIRALQKTSSPLSLPCSSSSGVSDTMSLCVSDPDQESDKLSVVSETDSGVYIFGANATTSGTGSNNSACSSRGSRPSSFLGGCSPAQQQQPPTSQNSRGTILTPSGLTISCECCHKSSFYVDEQQLSKQPVNLALKRLIQRYKRAKTPIADTPCSTTDDWPPDCKFCEDNANSVSLYCDSCGFFFCEPCKSIVHPFRGPLKDHTIVPASPNISKKSIELGPIEPAKEYTCDQHADEILTMYCIPCARAICCKCINTTRHTNHNVQSLATTVKIHKSDLSKTLTELSSKAKKAHEGINQLKQLHEQINVNCEDFKQNLNLQVDAIIQEIEQRRKKLLDFVDMEYVNCSWPGSVSDARVLRTSTLARRFDQGWRPFEGAFLLGDSIYPTKNWLVPMREHPPANEEDFYRRDNKRRILRDQIGRSSSHLNKTTGLIQFCIEILKETDPVAYLQIGSGLCNRTTESEFLWNKNMITKPEIDGEFVLNLDTQFLQQAIRSLEFVQLKAPPRPYFLASECVVENNSVVLSWSCPNNGTTIDGYILELDTGRDDGKFKEVYRGKDTICTVDGLHFNTMYNVQVRAYNSAGESEVSDIIAMQTPHVAWFQLLPQVDMLLNNDCRTVSGTTLAYRVALGSVAFSRGIHYWEITIDRIDVNTDVVVGIANQAVDTRQILGKDLHGWSLYVDLNRAWFLHGEQHHGRLSVGINVGSVIGVCLDMDRGNLRFFINDRPLIADGSEFAFKSLPRGLYSPAFSVNKGATITVHTGLTPPSSCNPQTAFDSNVL